MTQEEKIKDLEQRISVLHDNNSQLCAEIDHWRKVAAGLKGRNKTLSKQILELGKLVERYKKLDLEGDEINEKRIVEIAEKDKIINGLSEQVKDLSQKIKKSCDTIFGQKKEIEELNEQILILKRPWWKKIF